MANQSIPTKMQALMYDRPFQTLMIANSWPVPQPDFNQDEHLLKVHSTAITTGELDWPLPEECYKDYSPGVEMCGIVVASPPGSKFPIGTEIYMRTTGPRPGSAREYTIGLGKELACKPKTVSSEEAAAVPVSALTAWQALFVQADYNPPNLCAPRSHGAARTDKRVMIIGASGSVGLWTTQLARAAGCWVVGTSHTRNVALVRDIGAQEVIDYTKMSVRQWINDHDTSNKFDLVLDCVVPGGSTDAWHSAHPDGGLVLSIVPPDDMALKWSLERPQGISTNIEGRFFIMDSDGGQLQEIAELIDAGIVKPVVDSVFGLEEYKKAFGRVDSGMATGKVVMKVSE